MTLSASRADRSEASRPNNRRRWSEEEKRRIVAEAEAPGASVSVVARRHDLNANLLFTWRRRFRREECGAGVGSAAFIPAVIAPDDGAEAGELAATPREPGEAIKDKSAPRPPGLIEIILPGGRRVIVDKEVSAAALGRVIGVLERQ
jgi:transposase